MSARPFTALLAALLGAAVALQSSAAPAAGEVHQTSSKNPEAQAHWERAHDLYGKGSYREAISELEQAVAIDPNGPVLILDLEIVHERLGDIDDAIAYAQRYLEMELSPPQRAYAERMLSRLAGAKTEVLAKQAEEVEKIRQAESAYGVLPVAPPEVPRHGRFDAATVTMGALALAAAGAGTGFAVEAWTKNLANKGVYAGTATKDQLAQQTQAHRDAIIADISFAGAIACGVTTAILYLARTTKDDKTAWMERTAVSVAPTSHGSSVQMSVRF